MDRQTKSEQLRRWKRNPSLGKNSTKHHRRHQWWRTRTTGNHMDQKRVQTKKHSNRSLLWPPRKCKNWRCQGNVHNPQQSNHPESNKQRGNNCRRLQRKTTDKQIQLQTTRIQEWETAEGNDRKQQPDNSQLKFQLRKLDKSQSKENRREISHRLHTHNTRHSKINTNAYNRWRGTPPSKRKIQKDHNTILMSIKIKDPREPTYRESWKQTTGKDGNNITKAYKKNARKIQ